MYHFLVGLLLLVLGMGFSYIIMQKNFIKTDAVETMDDGMIVLDMDWRFIFCNKSAKILFPDLETIKVLNKVKFVNNWPKELNSKMGTGQVTFNFWDTKNKELRAYCGNVSKAMNSKNIHVGWTIVIRDMTKVMQLIGKLEELATTDALTGLLNRHQFMCMVENGVKQARRFNTEMQLIIFDLDFFKKINDTYGHSAGDRVLYEIAREVKSKLREYDVFARYGGEEFSIFTPCANEGSLAYFANRLCSAIEGMEIEYEGKKISITASFGALQFSGNTELERAINIADIALYKAKALGRNQVVVEKVNT